MKEIEPKYIRVRRYAKIHNVSRENIYNYIRLGRIKLYYDDGVQVIKRDTKYPQRKKRVTK